MTAMTGSRVEHDATEMAHHTTGLTRGITPYLQLAPLVILMLVFAVVPLVGMLAITFFKSGIFGLEPQLTLANYVNFTGESTYVRVLIKSMRIAFIVTAATIVISYPVAFWLAKVVIRHKLLFPLPCSRHIGSIMSSAAMPGCRFSEIPGSSTAFFSEPASSISRFHGCSTTSSPLFSY